MWGKCVSRGIAGIALGVLCAGGALAADKSVAERMLDIMRAKGQLSEQEYQELLAQAKEETAQKQEAASARSEKPEDFRAYWDDGLKLETNDQRFALEIGGRLQNDWAYFDGDKEMEKEFGELGNGTEFRRARLKMEGTLYEIMDFELEYDFAGGEAELKDAWIGLNRVPLPYTEAASIGHFKEPFSLEELTSNADTTFLERALPNIFAPSRNTGFMLNGRAFEDRMSWAVGTFREVDDFGAGFGRDSQYNLTTRFTALPWFEQKGRRMLHLGFGYSHLFRANDELRYRQRPEAHLAPRFVDTDDILTDGVNLIGPEFALVYDSLSFQGEYMRAMVDRSEGKGVDFDGYYVQASYFVTGETRPYKLSRAGFSRVEPIDNFNGKGGPGAWELALRYSRLDLNDRDVKGGALGNITAGINWYLNPNIRFMFNYTRAKLDGTGDSNLLQMRAQLAF